MGRSCGEGDDASWYVIRPMSDKRSANPQASSGCRQRLRVRMPLIPLGDLCSAVRSCVIEQRTVVVGAYLEAALDHVDGDAGMVRFHRQVREVALVL